MRPSDKMAVVIGNYYAKWPRIIRNSTVARSPKSYLLLAIDQSPMSWYNHSFSPPSVASMFLASRLNNLQRVLP